MRLQSHYVRGWTLHRFGLDDCCPRGHLRRSSFAPAVAHVGPGRGRFPFPWCCLASLVMFGRRQSPPPTNHRWPGSCARLASRNPPATAYLSVTTEGHSSLHPSSYSSLKELVSVRGVSRRSATYIAHTVPTLANAEMYSVFQNLLTGRCLIWCRQPVPNRDIFVVVRNNLNAVRNISMQRRTTFGRPSQTVTFMSWSGFYGLRIAEVYSV